ncbi:MAG TPA: hypothetical protein VML95_09490 [Longimicrobiales bacterium]|nr:hypothetical protein [Longimicrobiales bacterium]
MDLKYHIELSERSRHQGQVVDDKKEALGKSFGDDSQAVSGPTLGVVGVLIADDLRFSAYRIADALERIADVLDEGFMAPEEGGRTLKTMRADL